MTERQVFRLVMKTLLWAAFIVSIILVALRLIHLLVLVFGAVVIAALIRAKGKPWRFPRPLRCLAWSPAERCSERSACCSPRPCWSWSMFSCSALYVVEALQTPIQNTDPEH